MFRDSFWVTGEDEPVHLTRKVSEIPSELLVLSTRFRMKPVVCEVHIISKNPTHMLYPIVQCQY